MKTSYKDLKLIATVKKNGEHYETLSINDLRINQYRTNEYISERNVKNFINAKDLKDSLNWNLNGDSSKFKIKGTPKKNIYDCFIYD